MMATDLLYQRIQDQNYDLEMAVKQIDLAIETYNQTVDQGLSD